MLAQIQKQVDKDLAASNGVLDLIEKSQESKTKYPKLVTEILLCDTQAGGATHAQVCVTLAGGGERVVLRLTCGQKHELAVRKIFRTNTDVNGLVVFGVR